MITAARYDIICFQLRNNFYSQLQSPLKKEINRLSSDIITLIISGKKIKVLSTTMLSQVFNLRVKALKWLLTDPTFDYREMFKSIFPQIEELRENKKLEVLSENILFALRCNQRVAESIMSLNEFLPKTSDSNPTEFPDVTYAQFAASFVNIDSETKQRIIDWTNSSLNIEFVLLAADIISNKKLEISDKTINDLAFLVADSAQEYIALATELGALKSRSAKESFPNLSLESEFIKEQKQFADLGLIDYARNLPNL